MGGWVGLTTILNAGNLLGIATYGITCTCHRQLCQSALHQGNQQIELNTLFRVYVNVHWQVFPFFCHGIPTKMTQTLLNVSVIFITSSYFLVCCCHGYPFLSVLVLLWLPCVSQVFLHPLLCVSISTRSFSLLLECLSEMSQCMSSFHCQCFCMNWSVSDHYIFAWLLRKSNLELCRDLATNAFHVVCTLLCYIKLRISEMNHLA